MAEQADATVSKTVGRRLPCRFDPDLRHHDESSSVIDAELCSGSTKDFESFCPGSNPGSAKRLFPDSSTVERAAVNR